MSKIWGSEKYGTVTPGAQVLVPQYYPSGKYVLKYDGEGTIGYSFDGVKNVGESTPGRDVLDVSTADADGTQMTITVVNEANHLRNIRVCHIDHEAALDAGEIFNPRFLEAMQPFKCIRFLAWQGVNNSPNSTFSSRNLPTTAFWGNFGAVPHEHICALLNQTSKDGWVLTPHLYMDAAIEEMATFYLNNLTEGQNLRIEWSNEVWNPTYDQYDYASAQGDALWPGQGTSHDRVMNFYAKRSKEMGAIWKAVWGSQAHRLKTVFNVQVGSAGNATYTLNCPIAGGQCYTGCDELSIAPYFGGSGCPTTWPSEPDGGLSKIFTRMFQGDAETPPASPAGGFLKQTRDWIVAMKAVADAFGIPLSAYEAGQHFYLSGEANPWPVNNMYIAAQRDARMGYASAVALRDWREVVPNGMLFYHFHTGKYTTAGGSWGARESYLQPTTPKLDALIHHAFLQDTGINLDGLAYYSPEYPFLNLFHAQDRWVCGKAGNEYMGSSENAYIQMDSDGYPTSMTPLPGGTFTNLKCFWTKSWPVVNV